MPLPDLSYPGNHMNDIDNFFIVPPGVRPFIAMVATVTRGSSPSLAAGLLISFSSLPQVDRTLWGDEVHGVLHGHKYGNGTKMWSWGQNQLTDWTQVTRLPTSRSPGHPSTAHAPAMWPRCSPSSVSSSSWRLSVVQGPSSVAAPCSSQNLGW